MSGDTSKKHRGASAPSSSSGEHLQSLVDVISRSQQNYRDLVDNLDQAIFTLTLEGEIRVANRRLSEIVGVSFQNLIGHRLDEFVASPTLADAKRVLPQFLTQGFWEGMLPVRFCKDTALRFFKCWLMPVMENGEFTSINGWARDITSQHESEIRFSELFESLREGLFFSSIDGEILDVNPALVRMLGYESKEDLRKRNFREIYLDPAVRASLVQEVLDKGAVQDREIVLRRKDGNRIHCLASGFAIRDASGSVVRLQGTLVDFTERLEIEKRLHQEQEFVRRLVASFPDMVAVLDCDGRFTYVSQLSQEALGYAPSVLVGQFIGSRAHPEDKPKMTELFRQVVTGLAPNAQIEYRTRHADGTWRILRASAGPLFDESGKINGVVASARDVTEVKQAEKLLAQKEKFAAMGQMMVGAAHELNNPLTAILGVSELIRERATDDPTRRHAELILNQTRRAATIVQNLLALSRASAQGRLPLRVDDVIREALHSQETLLRQKNITVEFNAPPDVPLVTGDKKLLSQVFLNIIANAAQAISSTRNHGTLKISMARVEGKLCVTFADDGPGIPHDILGKVFDAFFTTKRPGGGSGLGLTICHAVMKDHGASIEAHSTPGAGAAIQLLFPVAKESSTELRGPEAAAKMMPGSESLRGHSVLIVDDEESIREIVEEGLSARGMKVDTAGSSEEALSRLATNSYEIVLCDMNLPGLNGEELLRRLGTGAGEVTPQFVFMSGDLLDRDALRQFGDKDAHVLQKPFHVSALASLLTELLQPQASRVGPA